MKTLLILGTALLLNVTNVMAMRCQNGIVDIGDAQYDVIKHCGQPDSEHTLNTGGQGDKVFMYYKAMNSNNLTEEVVLVDGHVFQINDIYN